MGKGTGIAIRPFDGSRADAERMLAVERATFNESPYTAPQVQTLLTGGPQRAWLAARDTTVVGFVVAFLITGSHGCWWEIDLLAVHPDWRGRHLGSRLVEAAAAYGASLAREARAVVADDNRPSLHAFMRAGFRAAPETCSLLIYRPSATPEMESRPTGEGIAVRDIPMSPGPTLLVAGASAGSQPAGRAELIEVQTILYHGVWIESLHAQDDTVRRALIRRAVNRMREAGLDEISAMVPDADGPLQQALVAAGFRSLGRFRWLAAWLSRETGCGAWGHPAGKTTITAGHV